MYTSDETGSLADTASVSSHGVNGEEPMQKPSQAGKTMTVPEAIRPIAIENGTKVFQSLYKRTSVIEPAVLSIEPNYDNSDDSWSDASGDFAAVRPWVLEHMEHTKPLGSSLQRPSAAKVPELAPFIPHTRTSNSRLKAVKKSSVYGDTKSLVLSMPRTTVESIFRSLVLDNQPVFQHRDDPGTRLVLATYFVKPDSYFVCLRFANSTIADSQVELAFTAENHRKNTGYRAAVQAVLSAITFRDWSKECQSIVIGTKSRYVLNVASRRLPQWLSKGTTFNPRSSNNNQPDDLWLNLVTEIKALEARGCKVQIWYREGFQGDRARRTVKRPDRPVLGNTGRVSQNPEDTTSSPSLIPALSTELTTVTALD